MLFDVEPQRYETDGAIVNAVVGGSGPPLLLLHGYPQTHVAWHQVWPTLCRHFTVVAPDMRGYGASAARIPDAGIESYSKRALAADQLQLMSQLGFARFAVMAHDRGARVGYRLALDHPDNVAALVSLTVIPTWEMWARANRQFGLHAYHWFLFAQPFDLPERLLAADPAHFLDLTLDRMTKYRDRLLDEAVASYRAAFQRPEVRHAICQDYRAGATIDLAHDEADLAAGSRIECPLLVTWEQGTYLSGPDPIAIWRRWATHVEGAPIDAGHLQAEEAPDAVLELALPFLLRHHSG
ncbi:alpha/beta fold hydrolase [Chelatococcus asaccharovorans]|uniref:alpha/beta fold hydrolase n=1 Tax=Chelatococcus asaccharovorans TaxID=28210 RepID=UPI00224C721D|nr:alpha/beta hydrolase [Chelatococcus asaccharovorans]CAH1659618.1 Fluoroacetate dehalogenase [Chelatococcus asaccharovorans]CAH1684123.1 Fluoroacetate dehalogenase [Chelatococcus asaccharovorans]